MTGMTHMTIGVVCYGGVVAMGGDSPDAAALGVAAIGAIAPDIDHPGSRLGFFLWPLSHWIEGKYGHRTITHSLVGVAICALLCLPFLFFHATREWYGAALVGYISHLFADAATKSGVPFCWPNRARFVFPGNRDYRVTTGSMAEFGILVFFLLVGGALVPIAKAGPRRLLHIVTGDMAGALRDQEDYGQHSHTEAEISGYDTLEQKTIEGRFPVVGRRGDGALLIERDGVLWVVKETGDEQYRIKPRRVRIYETTARQDITQVVRAGNLTIGALARLLPEGARVTGEMGLYTSSAPRASAPPVGIHTVAFSSENRLVMEFATRAHLLASSPSIGLQPGTITISFPRSSRLPRLLWPTHRAIVTVSHMQRHADLIIAVGSFVRAGQKLNKTFAQRIERRPEELPLDPLIAIAATEKRHALVELRALEREASALRTSSLWPTLAPRYAARRAALQSQADEKIDAPASREPVIISGPLPPASRAPFDGVVETIAWEAPTIPSEKGEKPEHSAQISMVQVKR